MWKTSFADWGNGFCGWGASFGHGPWFLGWLFPLLFWGLILYLLVSIFRHVLPGRKATTADRAVEVLRTRFASGEINEQEYATQKKVLDQN